MNNIYSTYVSEKSSNLRKQVFLLTIPNGKKWHHLAEKENISIIKRNNIKKKW